MMHTITYHHAVTFQRERLQQAQAHIKRQKPTQRRVLNQVMVRIADAMIRSGSELKKYSSSI